MLRSLRPMLFSMAAIASAADAALAQPAPASPRQACMSSALSLCPAEAATRDRPAMRACLMKNWDKVAPDCRTAIKAAHDHAAKP